MSRKKSRRQLKAEKAAAKKAKPATPKQLAPGEREVTEQLVCAPADLDPQRRWHLVYTTPRGEARAAKALAEAGCEVFWPHSVKTTRFAKRKPIVNLIGTYPRYLLVAGVPFRARFKDSVREDRTVVTVNGRPIDDIRDVDGVVDVIGTAAGWLRVPPAAVQAIADYQNEITPVSIAEKPALRPGQAVVITAGPFMDFQATVVESIGLEAARVLIAVFGGPTPVHVPLADLRAA